MELKLMAEERREGRGKRIRARTGQAVWKPIIRQELFWGREITQRVCLGIVYS